MNQMTPAADFVAAVPTMTRSEKLLRWAELIRKTDPGQPFVLMHRLEYYSPKELDSLVVHPGTAFALAARDAILRDAGLVGQNFASSVVTVGDVQRFFELKQEELHEFSCDCGGAITNTDMADRIENIAHGRGYSGNLSYVRNFLRF